MASASHSHSLREPSSLASSGSDEHSTSPPISFSVTEAMDDAPEPSPIRVSFNETKPAPNAAKRASLYAAQDTVSSPSPAPPYNARYSTLSPEMAERPRMSSAEGFRNPFGFQTQTYTAGKPPIRNTSAELGKRRGHRYKHSSVSHQIFLEPIHRTPLRLPKSLPVPTTKEGWKSMSREQTLRLAWCFCHLGVAGYVQWSAHGSLAVTALAHLIFYDAIGAFLCAGVDVLGNFDVWKMSTIRQPFGLERTEVLVGFAMSILLVFMGFDLISHNARHVLESSGTHVPHTTHTHARASAAKIDFICLLTVSATIISALMLGNHGRLARQMRLGIGSSGGGGSGLGVLVLGNPSHLFTIGCSGLLVLGPYLIGETYEWFDKGLSTLMALLMCILGVKLVTTLGGMLLMSYSDPVGVAGVIREIEADAEVKEVVEAKFWQVHYGLCMANLKLRVRGSGEDVRRRLRERVGAVIRKRLGGAEGKEEGGLDWEVSTQLITETN